MENRISSQNHIVSVIVTTHGRVDFLPKALLSVESQTYKNLELILVDDNADNQEIRNRVTELMALHSKWRVIRNTKTLGGSLTRNEGIVPALESSHAIAFGMKLAKKYNSNESIIINLSGRGDKDMNTILNYLDL